jgi:uncharacterized protein (DUF4213/DUF364 family)
MKIINELLAQLEEGEILDVVIGTHWTAVRAAVNGEERCGLASTVNQNHQHGVPDVPQAGTLHQIPAAELASLALSEQGVQASVGIAAINALLPRDPVSWVGLNAEEVIARQGEGKKVALIGNFPFIKRLRPRVGELFVIERNPRQGDYPEAAAPEILPQAELVAVTSMTFINHSLENVLAHCSPEASLLMLGPSTPLSPLLYECGIDFLSGSIVTDIDSVLRSVRQGANFRQVHRAGVRLVTMHSDAFGM